MKNTTFVSAGAGSGKTYRLTQDIAQLIAEGKCRAEEIILTTYTEAAAKELREKVRSTLYSKGLYDAAMNIDNAAIGTIHSIAYQFVARYWYLLGISANVSIMDTDGSNFCISQSLASLPSEEDLQLFDTILKSFNVTKKEGFIDVSDPDYWKGELKGIIDKTVELCVDEAQLEEARDESKNLLSEVMMWNGFDVSVDVVNDVRKRLRLIFDAIADHANKDKEERRKELFDSLKVLEGYDGDVCNLPLSKLQSLVDGCVKKPQKYLEKSFSSDILYLQELTKKIPASNQVKDLAERYIDTIFRLAIQWKKEYEEFKRKRCLLDYSDLLQKFDELLRKEEVVADIQSRYKVALVDEYQDCSPLQVRMFKRLSELMTKSVWVGDIKQAIYGFRGTNTELISSVIREVGQEKDGNKLDHLEHCWRSNETIVNLVNHIFCEKVFRGEVRDELIRLGMPKREAGAPPAPKERELQHIHFVSGTKKNIPEALADKVKELITSGTFKAKEIAILYRDKYGVKECIKALKERGIAYNVRLDNNEADKEGGIDAIASFIHAVVSLAARGDNELSKAIIANRIEEGCSVAALLTDRLQTVDAEEKGKNWLSEVDFINRIADIRRTIGNQSVGAAIETLVVELNLADMIKRVDPTAPTYNYGSALETKAATYERMCANFGMSSTLVGFVDYLKLHPIEFPGDDNGVSVMTYHKSKGLEWPCVILCSLDNNPVDVKKAYFGVLTHNTAADSVLRLFSKSQTKLCASIMDRIEEHEFFKGIKQATINEAKRLMYVGMTRPKEQLILTTYGPKNGNDWLGAIGCDEMNSHSTASAMEWGGAEWNHAVVNYEAPDSDETAPQAMEYGVLKTPAEHSSFAPKHVSPSKAKAESQPYSVKQCATFAERISATATDGRDSTIGDFIHHVMCLWNGDEGMIENLAEAYGVKVDVEAVATSITAFWNWMEQTYGKPLSTERELPFSFTNALGQVVTGEMDLVYHTAEGDVLVDYKTYQGSRSHLTDAEHDHYAGKYSGQIALYEEALHRRGSMLRDRLVCYLSLGTIISFES